MKKKLAVLLSFAIFLSGCTLSTQNEKDGDVLSGEVSKVIVWGMFEKENNIKPLIDKFESENPDVDIEYTFWEKDEYIPKLKEVLQDGNPNTTPDIFMIHNSWVGNYSSFVANAPSSVYKYEDYKSDFHDFVAEDFASGESVRGIPLWVDLLGLVYHKPYLIESGDTSIASNWNDFRNQAVNMTKFDENESMTRAGFSGGRSSNVEFSFEVLNLLFLQSRNQPFTKESLAVPFEESEADDLTEALSFYKSFTSSSDSGTWNSGFKLDTAAFIEGKLASIVLPTWRIVDVLAFDKDRGLNLQLGTTEVPQLNPETLPPVAYPTYWGFVVSKDSTKVNKAWAFLKYLSEKPQQEQYMALQIENGRPFSMISPRRDLLEASSQYPLLVPYIESIDTAHTWNMINGEKLKETYTKLLEEGGEVGDIDLKFKSIEEDKNVI